MVRYEKPQFLGEKLVPPVKAKPEPTEPDRVMYFLTPRLRASRGKSASQKNAAQKVDPEARRMQISY